MIKLIILQQLITNGYKTEFLFLLALISIFFAISIIIAKNPILSVLALISLFFTIALYLMLLGLYFIGLSYLLVYVGAVSILFLFILMLINVRISELLTEVRNSLPLAILTILSFNYSVNTTLPHSISFLDTSLQFLFDSIYSLFVNLSNRFYFNLNFLSGNFSYYSAINPDNNNVLANISSKSWDTILIETTHITSIGNILYTNLFILLIVTGFILLLAMVGCIVITVKDRSNKLSTNLLQLENSIM